MTFELNRHNKFVLLVVFLVVSAVSSRAIPFLTPWGADLQNLHAYQKCAVGQSPYLIDGTVCGDLLGRSLYYPPLLFHSFRWLRGLSLETAAQIWATLLVIAFTLVPFVWMRMTRQASPDERRWELPVFVGLLLLQYPSVFSLERGGTDVGPLLLGTLGAWFIWRDRFFLGGLVFGLATAYKLYPVFSCLVIGLGLLLAWLPERGRGKPAWLRFGGGAAFGFFGVGLIFFRDSLIFFRDTLPGFAEIVTKPMVINHSIFNFVKSYTGFGWVVAALVLMVWSWAAARAFTRNEPVLALAGALAISTYFSGTCYDYNLVTAYPLLVLLFMRARALESWGLFALTLFSVVGERQLFVDQANALLNPYTHFALGLGMLIAVAITVAVPPEKQTTPLPP